MMDYIQSGKFLITVRPSKNTHILQCFYSISESLFRWGISTESFANENKLKGGYLTDEVGKLSISRHITPVSRAYQKLMELKDYYFPKWNWIIDSSCIAVDIGASPGGWSQVLSDCCSHVFAVDPGLLHPSVLQLPNVTHINQLLESDITLTTLKKEIKPNKLSLCVCDVNFNAIRATKMIIEHIIPLMNYQTTVEMVEKLDHSLSEINEVNLSILPSDRPKLITEVSNLNNKYIIITLKLPKNAKMLYINNIYNVVRGLLENAGGFDFHLLHLHANSKNERTVVCRL